ncbi:MAG TPA: SRPBCC family protein [Anaerolineae bacterium]|nr:SRPBCC family protein [Anaerolineae bacterium]
MSTYQVSASAIIPAPPATVYNFLIDYEKHATILPPQFFKNMTITAGGVGAGTEITVDMEVLGTKHTFHLHVTEPEPGRILKETDLNQGTATTFTFDPHHNGQQTNLTIATDYRRKPGIAGLIESWINPPIARHIYKKELELIAAAF